MCGLGGFCAPASAVSLAPAAAGVTTSSARFDWVQTPAADVNAVLSTDSFSTVYSSQTLAAGTSGYNYTGLAGDTTYYFMVKIATEPDTEYAAVSTRTVPVTPSAADITYITEDALLLEWHTGTNPETTQYQVSLEPGGVLVEGAFSGMYIAGSLAPNTAYTAKVRAMGEAGPTAYSATVTSTTYAPHVESMAISYSSVSLRGGWAQASTGNGYRLEVSLDTAFSSVIGSGTADMAFTTLTVTGLAPNTTYYYHAGTLNGTGMVSYGPTYSFVTLGAVASGLAVTAVWQSSAAVSWNAVAAAENSGFIVQASSTGFDGTGAVLSSSSYANVAALTVPGLLRHTGYTVRVGSLNRKGETNFGVTVSTYTLAWPVDSTLVTVTPSDFSAVISYVALPPVPQDLACNGYVIWVSSALDGSAPVHIASTADAAVSSFTMSGLGANRLYYASIGTYNQTGRATYIDTFTFHTVNGAEPGNEVVLSTGVAFIQLGWTPVSSEGYIMQVSTDIAFTGTVFMASTTNGAEASLTVAGLAVNTIYYAHAGAIYNGAAVYAPTLMLATLAPAPASASFGAIDNLHARVSWSAQPAGSGYEVHLSTAADFSGIIFSSVGYSAGSVSYEVQSLIPNTTYYGRVGTRNLDGILNYRYIAGTTTTYVSNPRNPFAADIQPDTITFNWDANGNPSGSVYRVRNYLITGVLVSSALVANTSHTFSGLASNTSYYIDITAYGNNGSWSESVYLDRVITAANAPANLALENVYVTSVTVSFGTNSNPAETRYIVQAATVPLSNCGTFGELCSVIQKTVYVPEGQVSTTVALGALYSNKMYYMRAEAVNALDISSWSAVALSSVTMAGVPAYVGNMSTDSFRDVLVDQLTLRWTYGTNFPTGNDYVAYLTTEAALSESVFIASAATTNEEVTFTLLSSGTVYYGWVKVDGISVDSPYWASVSTITQSVAVSTTSPSANYTLVLPFSYGNAVLFIPAGTFNTSVNVKLTQAGGLVPGPINSTAGNLNASGVGVMITVLPASQPNVSVKLTIPYRLADLPAGTDPDRLVIAFHDEARDTWVPLPSVSHTSARTVEAVVSHFSTYQIVEMVSSDSVQNVKVFPNPFNPKSGAQYMQFTRLPQAASVKFYTYLGELVREITADVTGTAKWDGKNAYGNSVGSGVYIVMIKSADGLTKKMVKAVVER